MGGIFITKYGFSPDAFVQMAFQAAYYGLYGACPPIQGGFLCVLISLLLALKGGLNPRTNLL